MHPGEQIPPQPPLFCAHMPLPQQKLSICGGPGGGLFPGLQPPMFKPAVIGLHLTAGHEGHGWLTAGHGGQGWLTARHEGHGWLRRECWVGRGCKRSRRGTRGTPRGSRRWHGRQRRGTRGSLRWCRRRNAARNEGWFRRNTWHGGR